MHTKRFLFVMRRAPAAGQGAQEALDAALTAAAFDQPVRLLFLDDGVWQLQRGQESAPGALYGSLALYDVETPPLVEAESLDERGLSAVDLSVDVALVPRRRVPALLKDCDLLLNL